MIEKVFPHTPSNNNSQQILEELTNNITEGVSSKIEKFDFNEKHYGDVVNTTQNNTSVLNNKHYTDKKIQPLDYILANNLDFCEGNIIKYISRYKQKNGMEDLLKAKDYLNTLIEKHK